MILIHSIQTVSNFNVISNNMNRMPFICTRDYLLVEQVKITLLAETNNQL